MRIYKSFHGWQAESLQTVNGQDYQISTIKNSRGFLVTSAQEGQKTDSGFSFMMFSDKSHTLISEKKKATENTVKEQHIAALKIFAEKFTEETTVKKVDISKGLPIFSRVYSFGAGMSDSVYAVMDKDNNLVKMSKNYEDDYFGPFHTFDNHDRPLSKKFGIGFYWDDLSPDFRFSETEVNEAIKAGKTFLNQQSEAANQKAIDDENEKKQLVIDNPHLTPNYSNDKNTTKNNVIADLKKNFPGVKFSVRKDNYSTYTVSWTNGPEENEVRKVTGNYVDHCTSYCGDFRDPSPTNFTDVFGGFKYVFTSRSVVPITEPEKIEEKPQNNDFIVSQYSDKSLVLRGNTKPIKEALKSIGGVFNFRLSGGPGWIFKNEAKQDLDLLLSLVCVEDLV